MIYTVRYAHLREKPRFAVGDLVFPGDIIGTMGNSGQSTGAHLHLDVVEGEQAGTYSLHDIELGRPPAAPPRQALYFLDRDLFGIAPLITTQYADPEYFATFGKVHPGFDLVPQNRRLTDANFAIKWNRTMNGRVVRVAFDQAGYGHHIQVAYEA